MTYGVFDLLFGEDSDQVNIGALIDKYNGGIINIDRGIGNSWTNEYTQGLGRYGDSWAYGRLSQKTITVDYIVYLTIAEAVTFRRELAGALDCPNGPRRLIFGDEPNLYYNAVVDGSVTFSETIGESKGEGTITFIIPDGLAHSIAPILITKDRPNDYGQLIYNTSEKTITAEINNPSNVDSYPKIKITHTSDNGWVGIVNQNGIMEMGVKEAGINGYQEDLGSKTTQVLIDYSKKKPRWNDRFVTNDEHFLIDPFDPYAAFQAGAVRYGANDIGYHSTGMRFTGGGNFVSGYGWTGGYALADIPADKNKDTSGSVNFRMDFNIKVWEKQLGMTGYLTVGVLDEKNNPICAYSLQKSDTNGDTMHVLFLGPDGTVKPLKRNITFGANNNEKKQKKPNVAFNSKKGNAFIIKDGARVTFGYNGKPYVFSVPEIQTRKATKIIISSGKKAGTTKPFMSKLIVESIKFTKHTVTRYDTVENKYLAGSSLTVDLKEGTIIFNPNEEALEGNISQGELVLDSEFFSIPKGKSKLEFLFSSWITDLPDVEIMLDENQL